MLGRPQFAETLQQLLERAQYACTYLERIYDRLEHVKVDSYVNARIVDSAGVAPVPAGVGGLLVEWLASVPSINANVTNETLPIYPAGGSLPVGVVGEVSVVAAEGLPLPVEFVGVPHVLVDNVVHTTVDNTVDVNVPGYVWVRPQVKRYDNNAWVDQIGIQPSYTTIQSAAGVSDTTPSGGYPINLIAAMDVASEFHSQPTLATATIAYSGSNPPWPYVNVRPNQ